MKAFGFKATTERLLWSIILILGIAVSFPALAAEHDFCVSYARNAVRQNDENQRRDCDFDGRRWHSNYDRHYRWCRDNSYDKVERAERNREKDLRRCRRNSHSPDPDYGRPDPDYGRPDYGNGSSDSDRREFCESYARTAVWQGNENRNKGCGFSGPLWHTDQRSHYSWCMSVSATEIAEVRLRRNRQLKLCGGDPR